MKPSTGQRGRLSVKQPRQCPAIPLLNVSKINHRSCHRRQGPLPRPLFSEPGNEEPVASSKERAFVTLPAAVWRQRRKASQCALAMRTPQRKFQPGVVASAPLSPSCVTAWTPLFGPQLPGWFSSHLCCGQARAERWRGPVDGCVGGNPACASGWMMHNVSHGTNTFGERKQKARSQWLRYHAPQAGRSTARVGQGGPRMGHETGAVSSSSTDREQAGRAC